MVVFAHTIAVPLYFRNNRYLTNPNKTNYIQFNDKHLYRTHRKIGTKSSGTSF